MSKDEDIHSLIALGLVILTGYGVYKVIKSFGSYKEGDELEIPQLSKHNINISSNESLDNYFNRTNPEWYYYCDECKEITPHGSCGHCITCKGGLVGSDCGSCD